jgi:HTH-type transcriptional regulator, cell division transcriptional repressor
MYPDPNESGLATDDTLGGRISLARDACGLSLEDAACILDVDPTTWANWENDREEPMASRLEMIAGVLQVSMAWLISGRGTGPRWVLAP